MPSRWSAVPNSEWNTPPLEAHALGERRLIGAVDAFLGDHHRGQRQRGDRGGDLQRLLDQLFRRHHPRDETRALGLGRVHHAAGEAQIHRLGFADEAGEPLGAAGAGNDAELDFRLAEFGAVGGEDEVAHHRQFAAAAEREARDRGDDRLAQPRDAFPARDEVLEIGVHIGLLAHLLDVGAGGEGLVRAGDDQRADVGVLLEGAERGVEFVDQRLVERVERLRPIEPDRPTRPCVSTMMVW